MNTVVVTSFSPQGHELYGKSMIATFLEHWPRDVSLIVYHEHQTAADFPEDPRLRLYDLLDVSPACLAFRQRHLDDPIVRGRVPSPKFPWLEKDIKNGYNFRFDAWRFCHKPFAILHASKLKLDRLMWIDGDTITRSRVPSEFVDQILPKKASVSYLGRDNKYSECGFIGYRIPEAREMILEIARIYATDIVFQYPEWHDSFIFDEVRKRQTIVSHDLSREPRKGHVFNRSILGNHLIHHKGPIKYGGSRGKTGRNYPEEDQAEPS